MADDSMALLETLRKASAGGDVDILREGVRILASAIMEAEVSELTGLPKASVTPQRRLTHRNGYRSDAGARRSARSTWPSRASATAHACPACSSRGGAGR